MLTYLTGPLWTIFCEILLKYREKLKQLHLKTHSAKVGHFVHTSLNVLNTSHLFMNIIITEASKPVSHFAIETVVCRQSDCTSVKNSTCLNNRKICLHAELMPHEQKSSKKLLFEKWFPITRFVVVLKKITWHTKFLMRAVRRVFKYHSCITGKMFHAVAGNFTWFIGRTFNHGNQQY